MERAGQRTEQVDEDRLEERGMVAQNKQKTLA